MVRCSKCSKSYKQHTGECWQEGKCRKCWNKGRELSYVPPQIHTRLLHTPVDFYLDQYVQREALTIDN